MPHTAQLVFTRVCLADRIEFIFHVVQATSWLLILDADVGKMGPHLWQSVAMTWQHQPGWLMIISMCICGLKWGDMCTL